MYNLKKKLLFNKSGKYEVIFFSVRSFSILFTHVCLW